MGAAIGFALAQPAGITFAVFTALGLGLATPYLALSFQPAWTKILPRPGAWMEILKQLTAVPLFATVIWLAWVYGRLYSSAASGVGIDQVAKLLLCFLMLAIAGWTLSKWPARWSSAIAATLLAAIAIAIPLYQPKDTTLVWCLSCQVNERAVLRSDEVQHQFSSKKITLLKADWTQYDPEITKQLAAVNRSGVPTYVLYPANPTAMADVLPELLTKDVVLKALEKDTAK